MTARTQNALICAATPVVIAAYTPALFYRAGVHCEEVDVYLASAWQSSFAAELLRPHLGYYYLLMNVAAYIAAHWLPLLWTATFFAIVAVLVQILVVYTFLQCEAFASLSFLQRAIGAFIVLFAAPNLDVWVTLIDSNFLFLVIAGLLCLSDPTRRVFERTALLLIAGLSGPLAISLTPFFWLRAWRTKSRGAILQAIVLTACLFVQSIFLVRALTAGQRAVGRQWSMAGGVILVRDLIMPFFTRLVAKAPSLLLFHHPTLLLLSLATILAAFLLGLLLWLVWPAVPARWLIAFGVWTALFSIAGALNPTVELLQTGIGPRYSFPTNVFLGLAVLLAFSSAKVHTPRHATPRHATPRHATSYSVPCSLASSSPA
jgi:hypothetical protein